MSSTKRIKYLAALGFISVGCAWLLRSRALAWKHKTAALVGGLNAAATSEGTVSFEKFDSLPAPVAAYFRFALKEGQAVIRTATVRHTGEFSLNGKWVPFESVQTFSARPRGFVWDANMKMNAVVNVRVRDSYMSGRGSMSAKVLSLVTMVDAHDDPSLDAGSLMRYLAELAWLPTALLPSDDLTWTAIDDRRALATLSDGRTTVSLEFSFLPSGEIASFYTPARTYENGGEYKTLPWSGRLWNYEQKNGMMIPLLGEVAWEMDTGIAPYYKGKIVDAQYD